jgi:hypothetical protein
MKIYFDCEFTGLDKNAELISIGMVAENGKQIYVEFDDISLSDLDPWIWDNVISNLIWFKSGSEFVENYCYTSKTSACITIITWLKQFDTVEWVSDVCHYDFVLLIDLLYGNALAIPDNHSRVCYDINNDIAFSKHITSDKAFDLSREDLVEELDMVITGEKHNALYEAKVIKAIYDGIDIL